MSQRICPNCFFNNEHENNFCEECGSPLYLSDYINSKKVDKSVIDKIKSLFGKKFYIDDINEDIKNFIVTSQVIADYEKDLINFKSDKIDKSEFTDKYVELFELLDLKYIDYILKDVDLNKKVSSINRIKFFFDNYDKVEEFYKEFGELCDSNFYITFKQKEELLNNYKDLFKLVSDKKDFKEFIQTYDDMDSLIDSRNGKYVQKELIIHKDFFDDIDGKSLDDNQRLAVVRNEHNSQIIAGAGCGKTLTVNAKVRYLIEKKGINPNEILCLSFSNLSVGDLRESLPEDVRISTFHSLGASILKANNRPARVDEYALTNFIKDYFKNNVINNKKLCADIVDFFAYYLYSPITEDKASSLGEVYDLEASRDFRTLRDLYGGDKEKITYDNKTVKSFEELLIANYLFAHQIDYEYEKVFECDNKYYLNQKEFIFNQIFEGISEITDYPVVADKLLGDLLNFCEIEKHVKLMNYLPDFYLNENKIYLEHFGVNKECDALWLDKKGQKKYKDGIKWKREIHKKFGSNLIETYSYYSSQNRLLSRLEEKIRDCGVEIKDVDYEWLFSKIIERDDVNKFNNLVKLITEFIELFKGNDYNVDKFAEFKKDNENNADEFDKKRADLFLNIVESIYIEYEKHLKEISKIDFNDMINHATREVEKGNLHHHYRYILVDEYQDTSLTRYNLVKAIQDKTDAKICVVGDDWQSIYRFTGCDVSLFSNFEKYFKNPDKLTIDTTYRNSQELIDISGRFIRKNPNQINKSLNSMKDSTSKPVKIAYYNNSSSEDKIKTMKLIIDEISKKSHDIMILGRNNFDINDFVDGGLFKKVNNSSKLIYKENEDLNIDFISVHKSKGLEKDNVILINLENNIVGFPNQMIDDPLLNFVINDSDKFPYGEERRLFYVALTRTKNNIYLLVPQTDKSEFVKELEENIDELDIISNDCEEEIYDDMNEFMKNKRFYSIKTDLKCPVCKTGDVLLKIIKSEDGKDIFKFFDCSHRRCGWDGGYYYSHLDLLDEIEICPECGKVRYIADGRYGPYIKCSKECKKPKLKKKQLKKANEVFNKHDETIGYEYIESELICPKCGEGKITLKINPNNKKQQFACSNDLCDYDGGVTNIDKSKINKIKKCPKCEGILVLRNGKYGEFYSCNNSKCKHTENAKNKKSVTFEEIKTNLKCPVCGNGMIIIKKNKSKNGKVSCSNCDWDGGSFDKTGKIDSIKYCPVENCNGITYLRKGPYGEFRSCSNYFKTKCKGKNKSKTKKSKKEQSQSKWKKYDTKLTCPSCGEGDVILLKNKNNKRGFFKCTNNSCDWNGGTFNKPLDLLDTLAPCPNCDGLTYEVEGKFGPFRVCTNFAKTGCNAGRK